MALDLCMQVAEEEEEEELDDEAEEGLKEVVAEVLGALSADEIAKNKKVGGPVQKLGGPCAGFPYEFFPSV
jgi:hypothetical protein